MSEVAIYWLAEMEHEDPPPLKIGCSKIGISTNPRARLATLQTGNPRFLALMELHWLRARTDANRIEREIHKYLRLCSISGEWFHDNIGLIHEALSVCMSGLSYVPRCECFWDLVGPNHDMAYLYDPLLYPSREITKEERERCTVLAAALAREGCGVLH